MSTILSAIVYFLRKTRYILSLTAISIVLAALTLTSTDIDSARLFFYRLPAKESFCFRSVA